MDIVLNESVPNDTDFVDALNQSLVPKPDEYSSETEQFESPRTVLHVRSYLPFLYKLSSFLEISLLYSQSRLDFSRLKINGNMYCFAYRIQLMMKMLYNILKNLKGKTNI